MRILVALDRYPYRVEPKRESSGNPNGELRPEHPIVEALRNYREEFLSYFPNNEDSPYDKKECGYELIEVRRGVWEELYVCRSSRKDFRVRVRFGTPAKEILAEAEEEESDLIVLGCTKRRDCGWEQDTSVPQKVVRGANCSVLVVKEEKRPNKIVCCLDHDSVSQESLEMINQMVTLHQAELAIVGLTDSKRLREEVDRKMNEILRYYTAQKIKAWVSLVDVSFLDTFIIEAAEKALIALWIGKKSLLGKFFSQDHVGRLTTIAQSSVLILR